MIYERSKILNCPHLPYLYYLVMTVRKVGWLQHSVLMESSISYVYCLFTFTFVRKLLQLRETRYFKCSTSMRTRTNSSRERNASSCGQSGIDQLFTVWVVVPWGYCVGVSCSITLSSKSIITRYEQEGGALRSRRIIDLSPKPSRVVCVCVCACAHFPSLLWMNHRLFCYSISTVTVSSSWGSPRSVNLKLSWPIWSYYREIRLDEERKTTRKHLMSAWARSWPRASAW
jgi:hypothetical protein